MTRAALALLAGSAAGLLAATQPLSDPDLFWHLATGRETLAHGLVRSDVFSWSVRGAPVSTDQWLGQVILYGSYALAQWHGVAIVRVVAVTALVALVVAYASVGARRPLAIVLAAIPGLILTRAVWVDRPELLGLVFFAALLVLLRGAQRGRSDALIGCVAVIALWANVHGSFALGVVLAILVAGERALVDRVGRARWILLALAVVAASFATPAGLGAWTAPGSHFLAPPRAIQEWGVVDVRTPLGAAYVVTLVLVVVCAFLGPRLDRRDVVVLVPVLFLSLTAARQAPLLAIAAAPLLADRIDRLIARVAAPAAGGRPLPSVAALGVPALLLLAALLVAPSAPDESAYPVAIVAGGALPDGPGTLARYEWGGWLIWRAPATPVFVDGRLTPYSGGVIDDYRRVVAAAPGWRDIVARRGVRSLLVAPTDPVAVRAHELGWHEVRASDSFVLVSVP